MTQQSVCGRKEGKRSRKMEIKVAEVSVKKVERPRKK